jgi:hypothetical protein
LSGQITVVTVLALFLSLLAVAVPTVGAILTFRDFRTRVTTKPDPVETVVAIVAGLLAAALAGVIGFVGAPIACAALLTGEAGLILGRVPLWCLRWLPLCSRFAWY